MELLPLIRAFWRRRLLLGAGILVATVVMVGLGGTKPVKTTIAFGTTAVQLDTPQSEIVSAAPAGSDTLAWRADLLSHLMATASLTDAVAQRLGVKPYELGVVDPALVMPLDPTDTAEAATKVATTAAPYVLTTYIPDNIAPVIAIQAAAPTKTGAKRLAQAAVEVLQAQASGTGSYTSDVITGTGPPKLQPFVVDQVEPVHLRQVSSSSPPIKAIGGALFVLIAWWVGVLLVLPRMSRRFAGGRRAMASA